MSETNNTQERGLRKTRIGVVVSDKMDKTVTIQIKTRVRHPLYGKIMNQTSKLKVHDENNECGVGDTIRGWKLVRCPTTSAGAWSKSSRRPSNPAVM